MNKKRKADEIEEEANNSGDAVIELNVGGTVFHVLRSTLTKEEDSMLAKTFVQDSPFGCMTTKDKDGRPYLDRDAEGFARVLDYLRRGGRLMGAGALALEVLECLRDDAEFYGLQGLVHEVDRMVEERNAEAITQKAEARAQRLAEQKEVEHWRENQQLQLRHEYHHHTHNPLEPLDPEDEAEREQNLERSKQHLARMARQGFVVRNLTSDAAGNYLDMLLERTYRPNNNYCFNFKNAKNLEPSVSSR